MALLLIFLHLQNGSDKFGLNHFGWYNFMIQWNCNTSWFSTAKQQWIVEVSIVGCLLQNEWLMIQRLNLAEIVFESQQSNSVSNWEMHCSKLSCNKIQSLISTGNNWSMVMKPTNLNIRQAADSLDKSVIFLIINTLLLDLLYRMGRLFIV